MSVKKQIGLFTVFLLIFSAHAFARLSSMQRPKPDPYAFLALSEHTLRDIGLNRLGITVH